VTFSTLTSSAPLLVSHSLSANGPKVGAQDVPKASHELLDSVDATDAPFPTGTQGQKRKRYEICSQCDKEYDVREDERGGPQCRWHEGTVPTICC
jgi:hypothetical protein